MYNFAFEQSRITVGYSGWNHYGTNFTKWTIDKSVLQFPVIKENIISITNANIRQHDFRFVYDKTNFNEAKYQVEFIVRTNKDCTFITQYQYHDGSGLSEIIKETKINHNEITKVIIPPCNDFEELDLHRSWSFFTDWSGEITIEQIPIHCGCLCSDGIDDYGELSVGFPYNIGTVLFHIGVDQPEPQPIFTVSGKTEKDNLFIAADSSKIIVKDPFNQIQYNGDAVYYFSRATAKRLMNLGRLFTDGNIFGSARIYGIMFLKENVNEETLFYYVNLMQESHEDFKNSMNWNY